MSTAALTTTAGTPADQVIGPVPAPVALALVGVTRRFADRLALGPVSLNLDAGATCLVEGANGSGKTTLLRLAAGLLTATSGTRACAGPALYLQPGSCLRRVETARHGLSWAARVTSRTGESRTAIVIEAIDRLGLRALADQPVGSLSAGQQARVTLGLALVTRPVLCCLDEPTVHLDPVGVAAVRSVARDLATGGTALLIATHDVATLADIVDARCRLVDGRLETLE